MEGGEGGDRFLKPLLAFLMLLPNGTGDAPEDVPNDKRDQEPP